MTRKIILSVLKFVFISLGVLCIIYTLFESIPNNKQARISGKFMRDRIQLDYTKGLSPEDYKAAYMNNCLIARGVYQYQWYRPVKTIFGYLKLDKRFAMSLQEYNDLVDLSWELNRYICLPLDSPDNYNMISKWILESSLNADADHKTGEVIKFTGYTEVGLAHALFVYKHVSKIQQGSPFYIKGIYDSNADLQDIFSDLHNVLKFDYAYMFYLLQKYDYNWNMAWTAFHLSYAKTDFWYSLGLRDIPINRLDGKWADFFLKEYYLTIKEIAISIATGRMDRPSRAVKYIAKARKVNRAKYNYIETLRLKIKQENKANELEAEFRQVYTAFTNYMALNEIVLNKMGKLNDMTILEKDKTKIEQAKKIVKDYAKKLKKWKDK